MYGTTHRRGVCSADARSCALGRVDSQWSLSTTKSAASSFVEPACAAASCVCIGRRVRRKSRGGLTVHASSTGAIQEIRATHLKAMPLGSTCTGEARGSRLYQAHPELMRHEPHCTRQKDMTNGLAMSRSARQAKRVADRSSLSSVSKDRTRFGPS